VVVGVGIVAEAVVETVVEEQTVVVILVFPEIVVEAEFSHPFVVQGFVGTVSTFGQQIVEYLQMAVAVLLETKQGVDL